MNISLTAEQKVISHMQAAPDPVPVSALLDAVACSPRTIRRVMTKLHEKKQIHIHLWESTSKGLRPAWLWGTEGDAPKPEIEPSPEARAAKIKNEIKRPRKEEEIFEMEEDLRIQRAKQAVDKRIEEILNRTAEISPLEMYMLGWKIPSE